MIEEVLPERLEYALSILKDTGTWFYQSLERLGHILRRDWDMVLPILKNTGI